MSDTIHNLIAQHGGAALAWTLTALTMLATWALNKLVQSKALRDALDWAGMQVKLAVAAVGQTFVDECKAASADGILTDAEKAKAKEMAIAKAKSFLTWKQLAALGGGFVSRLFSKDAADARVDELLGNMVEAAVRDDKRLQVASGVAAAPAKAEPTTVPR
jgi:hypothetical protein